MKLTNLYIIFILTGGILYNVPIQALLKGITETVEKTTAGAAHAVEGVTGAIIPPAEKVVAAPLEVAKKTTTAVADVFRGQTLEIINNADQNLTVELMGPRRTVYSIVSINPGDRETVGKPRTARFMYGDLVTEVNFEKKSAQGPIIMDVTVSRETIRVKQTGPRDSQKGPKQRRSERKTKTKNNTTQQERTN